MASDTVNSLLGHLRRLAGDPWRIFTEGLGIDERLTTRTGFSVGALLFVAELRRGELPARAAATAYALLFALIPLFTTTLAFFTAFPGLEGERRRIEQALFTNLLPGAAQSVQKYIEQFAERAATAGAVSSLVFFVVVLMLFSGVEETFNRVWKAERARTWAQRLTLLAVFFVVGGIAITAILVLTTEAANIAQRYALDASEGGLAFKRAALGTVSLMFSWLLFVIANKWLPNARVRWGPALVGGVVAGSLWHFLKGVFTWYVGNFASYDNLYGAVAVLPVLLTWIYLTVLLLLVGGALAFVVQNHHSLIAERRMTSSRGPQRAWHAVALLSILAKAFQEEQRPVSAVALGKRLGVAQYVIGESVRPLVEAGVVLAIPCGAEQRYALGVPPEQLSVSRVIALTTGEDLSIPEEGPAELRKRVGELFASTRNAEGNALERVTIAELSASAPA